MEIKSQTNIFTGGMDLDSDLSSIPNQSWSYAENVRVVTNNDGSSSILNETDTVHRYSINTNWKMEGVVLGVVSGKSYNFESQYTDVAYVLLYRLIDNRAYNTLIEISHFDQVNLSNAVVCKGYWGITTDVQMILNCENRDVCKVYITDGKNTLKIINTRTGYNREIESGDIDITGKCILEPPKLDQFVSGVLPVGQVQYCYQLFSRNGIESAMSPVSLKIPISPDANNTIDVNGYPSSRQISTRGVRLNINISNASAQFNGLRLYRILYTSSTDDPTITLINESTFNNTGSNVSLTLVDDGSNALNELTIEQFNEIRLVDFTAQVLCKKDNRLFAANITESTWDVDYDVRAYRCNNKGIVALESINTNNNLQLRMQDIINGSAIIPEDHDCINPLNALIVYPQEDSNSNYSYTLVNNGSDYVFGGSGPNVSYYFLMTNLEESNNNTVLDNGVIKMKYDINNNVGTKTSKKLTVVSSIPNSTNYNIDIDSGILNYANPEIVTKVLSYQRDEIYRFGAVFYNERGIASPVHWIADVRFPDAESKITSNFTFAPFAYSVNSVATNIATSGQNELVSRPLGIRFEFTNIPEGIKAIEIVRCRRTESDRTVVTQGALSKVMLWDSYKADTETSHDARPFLIPGYSINHCVATIGKDGEHDASYPGQVTAESVANSQNLFDFTSADQCFNKDTEIVRPGDYIVPLYIASCDVVNTTKDISNGDFFNYRRNGGIQFQAKERQGDQQYDKNYTGAIIDISSVMGTENKQVAITDGMEAWCYADMGGTGDNWVIPCAEFKYYKFYDKSNATSDGYNTNNTRHYREIDAVKIATNIPNTEVITGISDIENKYIDQVGEYTYQNISIGGWANSLSFTSADQTVRFGIRGVSLIMQSDDMIINNNGDDYIGIDDQNLPQQMSTDEVYGVQSVLICNIKRLSPSQYGGDSYFSRSNSVYNIHCGYATVQNNTYDIDINCFGGDTYLGVLDHTYTGLYFPNDPAGRPNVAMNRAYIQTLFPLESSVNVYLRSDEHFLQSVTPGANGKGGYANTYYMTEVGVNAFGSQSEPMYTYNSAYSNMDGIQNKVPKGIYDKGFNEYPTRIITSDVKTSGEIIDSWSKFRFADYLDVDNNHGYITNLLNFNGRLFFFQDDALGIAQVNERSLITDQNDAELVLGTGTVLGRYDYVVQQYGDSKIRDKSIVTSTSTIYWYDYDKNILCAYNNSIIELSKLKKVQTYLNNTDKENKSSVVSLYDNKYNEVWFNIVDKPLIFNEQCNFFTSFYTHNIDFVLPFSDHIATIKDNNIYYIHNTYNLINSNVEDKICKLQLIINDNYIQTKVYDNVFFDAQLDDLKQITSIVFTTKTQYTDAIDYQVIDNREDTYRFFIPREHLDDAETQTKESMSYAARMRGKYLICDYTFNCNEERQIEIPFIKTTYRDSLV